MARLSADARHDLIAEYVHKAKINWAHVGIACLVKHGYVDRILTTNFDPLVVRACAMLGEFPAIYDIASSESFKPEKIRGQAVFYLHGQHTGFIILNTEAEVREHSIRYRPVFEEAVPGRAWIVVGYSGDNDPVFEELARVENFGSGLYWVLRADDEPPAHVRERLITEEKDAFYTNGYDADSFFVSLAQKLRVFPPDLLEKPFTHLRKVFDMLTEYTAPGAESGQDVTRTPKEWIARAIREIEVPERVVAEAQALLMRGEYGAAIALGETVSEAPGINRILSRAYNLLGNVLSERAKTKNGEEADRLFAQAAEKYAAALKIRPDMHEALNNWGTALSEQAKTKTGEEADRLFARAGEKYAAALKIKPDKHGALYNWGNALSAQAKTKTGEEADRLFAQAGEKYAAALKIKPDKHEALNNWGNALSAQANTKTGEEADRLFAQAGQK